MTGASPGMTPKLTPAQFRMLDRVCRSNGGGVFVGFNMQNRETKLLFRLHELGLVQGKAGDLSWAVHTRDGLKLWRSLTATEPTK